MASVYFVRDGYGDDNRMVKQESISSDIAKQLFNNFGTHFKTEEWYLNDDEPVNPISNTRHVVIKIESDDICDKFPNAGFYLIDNLSPSVYQEIISQQ